MVSHVQHIRRSWCLVSLGFACAFCCVALSVTPAHAFPDPGTTVVCESCNGTGFVLGYDFCPYCNGSGDDNGSPCVWCSGTGALGLPLVCASCDGEGSYDVSQRPVRLDDVTDSVDALGAVFVQSSDLVIEQMAESTGGVMSLDSTQFDKLARFSTGGVFSLVVVIALLSVVCGLLFASILVRLWRSR